MIVVTSFSPKQEGVYGRRFIESFLEYWDCPLWVFHEGKEPDIEGPIYRDLTEDDELQWFLENCPALETRDYRFQAKRFAKKVFAITNPELPLPRIWLDADVETVSPVDEDLLRLRGDISYLGRDDWDHSECGFVQYGENAGKFLERFRQVYMTGEIYGMEQWHDSYVFDRVLEEFPDLELNNLSEGISGNHVWPKTILGKYMVHHKGPKAKLEAYGEFA